MATPFSRSVRSLQADDFRSSLVGLLIAMALLSLWLAWFFFARVTIYEFSLPLQVTASETLKVVFPHKAQGQLKPGQFAVLKLDGDVGSRVGRVPALVTNVTSQAAGEGEQQVQTEVFIFWGQAPRLTSYEGLTGRLEVEVEHISPATLTMRTVGIFMDTPALHVSPQSSPDLPTRR